MARAANPLRFRPAVERLDARDLPAAWAPYSGTLLAASDGGPPVVHLADAPPGTATELQAYDPLFRGGVRVAQGDVTGDGFPDIVTAAGPGGGPHVKVFDGKTGEVVRSFFAYDAAFRGGVEVATGDVNGDGCADVVTGAGAGGGPHVKVFDGRTSRELNGFFPLAQSFRGGVFVAGGDVNGDGYDDVIVGAGAGGGSRVQAWDLHVGTRIADFTAFGAGFDGGARVAAGDVDGDGKADLIAAAGPGGGPRVRAFDVATRAVLSDRFAADPGFLGGVRVSSVPGYEAGRDAVLATTRTGDVLSATTYTTVPYGYTSTRSVWVGDGDPPPDVALTESAPRSPLVGSLDPIRTEAGFVGAVAADGGSMTLVHADGSTATLDLAGDPPLPPGYSYFDSYTPPARIVVDGRPATAADLRPGQWVRVKLAYASDLSRDTFTALSVQVL